MFFECVIVFISLIGCGRGATIKVYKPTPLNPTISHLNNLSPLGDPNTLYDNNTRQSLDLWGTADDRAALPIAVGDIAGGVSIINATVSGSLCSDGEFVNDWTPNGAGSNALGFLCHPLPEGRRDEIVSVEVWVDVGDGAVVHVTGREVIRFEDRLAQEVVKGWTLFTQEENSDIGTLQAGDNFGSAIAWVGDIDGDGMAVDIVVGVYRSDQGGTNRGEIMICSQKVPGTLEVVSRIGDGIGGGPSLENESKFGTAVAWVGMDLNGDGRNGEILVGAPQATPTGTVEQGRVFVMDISKEGVGTVMQVLESGTNGVPELVNYDNMGRAIAMVGDMNDNGVESDVAIAIHAHDIVDGWNTGGVLLLELLPDGSVSFLTLVDGDDSISLHPGSYFGFSLSTSFSLNGDKQILVGAIGDEGVSGGDRRGAVFVVSIHPNMEAESIRKIAHQEGGGPSLKDHTFFGSSVDIVGDINADGVENDVMIAAFNDDTPRTDTGAIFFAVLGVNGIANQMIRLDSQNLGMPTLEASAYFGASMHWVGDVWGDGGVGGGGLMVGSFGVDGDSISNTGGVYLLQFHDFADKATGAEITAIGYARRSIDTTMHGVLTTPTNPKPTLVSLDPFGVDQERRIIPLSVLKDTRDPYTLLSVSVGGRDCASVEWVSGWLSSSGHPRRAGVACVRAPEGTAGSIVDVSLTWRNDITGVISTITASNAVKYDDMVAVKDAKNAKYSPTEKAWGYGRCMAPLGDFEFDGIQEYILGAPYAHFNSKDDVGVIVVASLLPNAKWDVRSTISDNHNGGPSLSAHDHLGFACDAIGDTTGDGIEEVAIGIQGDDTDDIGTGAILVASFNSSGYMTKFVKITSGSYGLPTIQSWSSMGYGVTRLGQNGLFLAGAPAVHASGVNNGAGYVFFVNEDLDVTFLGQISKGVNGGPADLIDNGWFGAGMARLPIEYDDGSMDVVIGAIHAGTEDTGEAYYLKITPNIESESLSGAFIGKISTTTTTNFHHLDPASLFGYSICAIGDLTGDGWAGDLLIGAPQQVSNRGTIYLISLTPMGASTRLATIAFQRPNLPTLNAAGYFGTRMVLLGDYDGDGEVGTKQVMLSDSLSGLFISSFSDQASAPSANSIELSVNTSSTGVMCSTSPCHVKYIRGGEFVGGSSLVAQVVLTSKATLDVIEPLETSIGGVHCVGIEYEPLESSLHRATCRCTGLILPPARVPVPTPGATASYVTLKSTTFRYRERATGNVIEVTNNATAVFVHVPVSESIRPSASSPTWSPPPTLAVFNNSIQFQDFLAAVGEVPQVQANGFNLRPHSLTTIPLPGSSSYVFITSAQITGRLCGTGAPTTSLTFSTIQGSLEASVPSLALSLPSITGVTIVSSYNNSGMLDVHGGSKILIHGNHFGEFNLSDTTGRGFEMCGGVWEDASLVYEPSVARLISTDPRNVLLWAYVGGRPCFDSAWLSESTISCTTPPSIGSNVEVSVSVEGRFSSMPNAVSYHTLPPVTWTFPSSNLHVLGSGGAGVLDATSSAISLVTGTSSIQGISLARLRVGSKWFSSAPPSPLFPSTTQVRKLRTPPGGGANHSVSLEFADNPSSFLSGSVLNSPPRTAHTSTSEDDLVAKVSFQAPLIVGISPSVDLDPLGGDRLVIAAQHIGLPSVLNLVPIPVSVHVAGRECLDVSHVSNTEIRCTTSAMPGISTAEVVIDVGGMQSDPVAVSILRVSLLSIVPREVLPAAPGELMYTFSVSVFAAAEVEAVIIGGQRCDDPILEGEELLKCVDIPAPTRWETDNAWLEITGNDNAVSERPVLRAEPPPDILAVDTSAEGAPTIGGTVASVVGEGFGLEEADFAGIVVGGDDIIANATWRGERENDLFASTTSQAIFLAGSSNDSTWISSTKVTFVIPPGLGDAVPIRLATRTGLLSNPVSFRYDSPSISSITPNILLPGVENQTVQVCGRNFPPQHAWADSFYVGGVKCANPVVLPDQCVLCPGIATPGSSLSQHQESWPENTIEIIVGSQSSGPTLGHAVFVPLPHAGEPNTPVVSAGTSLRVQGSGMGEGPNYIVAVLVGGTKEVASKVWEERQGEPIATSNSTFLVSQVTWNSPSQLTFMMPPGVGVDVPIRFVTATDLISTKSSVSYRAPSVISVSPRVLLPGFSALNVTILGSDFATRLSEIDRVRVGGILCKSIHPVSTNELHCLGLDTPGSIPGLDDWPSKTVDIKCGGQSSTPTSGGAVFVPTPVITGVLPDTAGPGTTITIIGRGFGGGKSDVAGVRVGGEKCESVLWESGSQVKCVIPNPHPIWTKALAGDIVVPTVTVELQLTSSLSSSSSASGDSNPTFIPTGLRIRPNPNVTVSGLVAWRPVGQGGIVEVTWRYPGPALESRLRGSAAPVTDFIVHVSTGATFNKYIEVTTTRAGFIRPALESATEVTDPNAWEWHRTRVPVLQTYPLRVRVSAENSDGATPWVHLNDTGSTFPTIVPETCTESEYLATEADSFKDVQCKECPVGALCAGLTAENVTARNGYWRVPWSPNKLGFAACFIPSACLGAPASTADLEVVPISELSSDTDDDTTEFTAIRVWAASDAQNRPAAIAGVQLDPSVESCDRGHSGVLCGSCKVGYFLGVGGICEACGNSAQVAGRFVGLILAILFVFSFLLSRAWLSRASSSSKEVMIGKIAFVQLQSVAIVGSVQMRWPVMARNFFSIVNAGSSFTTSGLALECIIGSASQSPFYRTIAILCMPFVLVFFTALFWLGVGAAERSVPLCHRTFNPPPEEDNATTPPPPPTQSIDAALGDDTKEEAKKVAQKFAPSTPLPANWPLFRQRLLVSSIVIAFLVHTPLTSAAFKLLTCQPIAPEDDPESSQLRLAMSLDYNCEDPETLSTMLATSLPVLIIVSFGIPIALLVATRVIGKRDLQRRKWRERIGFLTQGFRPSKSFWESVVLLRKVLLAFVTTILAPSGAALQLLTAIVVLLLAQSIHSRARPYQSNVINALESFGLVSATLTLIGGVFIIVDDAGLAGTASSTVGVAASSLIIVINTIFLLAVVTLLSKRGRQIATTWLRRIEHGDASGRSTRVLALLGMGSSKRQHKGLEMEEDKEEEGGEDDVDGDGGRDDGVGGMLEGDGRFRVTNPLRIAK